MYCTKLTSKTYFARPNPFRKSKQLRNMRTSILPTLGLVSGEACLITAPPLTPTSFSAICLLLGSVTTVSYKHNVRADNNVKRSLCYPALYLLKHEDEIQMLTCLSSLQHSVKSEGSWPYNRIISGSQTLQYFKFNGEKSFPRRQQSLRWTKNGLLPALF